MVIRVLQPLISVGGCDAVLSHPLGRLQTCEMLPSQNRSSIGRPFGAPGEAMQWLKVLEISETNDDG